MARYKIVTTAGPGTGIIADYSLEMETLAAIGAEIVEVKGGEDELAAAAVDADAIYGKARPRITAKVINAGKKLKVVSLASVGVDSVDVDAATARGIPVTNCPDTFIEELVMSDYGVQPVGYDELLQRSDIVSMHAPGTKDAHHLMKEAHFRKMKKTALFVNTSRGSTVDEAAMIKALQEGWIAGAALDVLETEPVHLENPLLVMDNVILTAHVASASSRFEVARKRRVGAEMALVLSGKWPRACVNPAVLDKSKLERWQPYSMERGPGN